MEKVVETDNLGYRYGSRTALEGLTFSVGRGEIFSFLGPNGGGKTTAFKVLSTLFECAPGRARILGMDLARAKAAVRRKLGIVFQAPALDRKLRVRENLEHHGRLFGLWGSALAEGIRRNLERFGLGTRSQDRVEALSGGLRRRVELAKALLTDPEILILDEPSTGLDPAARREFWGLLEGLRKDGRVTVLVTTHYLEEADRCDRLLILDQGRTVAQGSPEELKAQIGGEVLRIRSRDPEKLAAGMEKKFEVKILRVDGFLQVERADVHELVKPLMEAFSGEILSVTLGPPSLEDVFLHRTGRRYSEERE